MSTPKPDKTIDQLFEEFLADQEARLSPKTFDKYEGIIHLYRSYLESYWPDHSGKDYDAVTKAKGTYCGTYGAEDITSGFSEFLGYFMPRKVIAGNETMKAAGTVVKKLDQVAGREGLHRGRRIGPGHGGRGRPRPARQPEAPRRAGRLALRDRPGQVRQEDRRPFPDPADRAEADLAGVDDRRRRGDRPDPGPREGRQGVQGRLGRRRRGRPDEQGLAAGRGLEHLAVRVAADEEGDTRPWPGRRPAARADQPRPSKAVRALREALGLDEADWQAFLWHARDGFADLEQADCMAPETTLRLCDVPDDWFEDPEALGYVAVRVLNEGKATLATPVARSLLAGLRPGARQLPLLLRGSAWRGCTWPGRDWPCPRTGPVGPPGPAHARQGLPRGRGG